MFARSPTGPRTTLAIVILSSLLLSGTVSIAVSGSGHSDVLRKLTTDSTPREVVPFEQNRISPRPNTGSNVSIPVGSTPIAIAYDSSNNDLYVANAPDGVTIVSTSNDSTVGGVGWVEDTAEWLTAETYDAAVDYVYVAGYTLGLCNGCSGTWAAAINGSTNQLAPGNASLGGIDSAHYFDCLGYDPESGDVYACDTVGELVIIDGATDAITGSVRVGSQPSSVAADDANGDVYVTNSGSNNVTVIQSATNSIVRSMAVGSEPDAMAYDSTNGHLYVANNASDNVTVIDATSNTVMGSIPVGCNPKAIAFDAANGDLFVVNNCSDNVTVVDGETDAVIGAVPVGSYPDAVAYDAVNGDLYVSNAGSDNVTVINPSALGYPPSLYSVTFTETGLPTGTNWNVTYAGLTRSSTTDTITFTMKDGSYVFTVGEVAGYTVSPGIVSVNVSGGNVTQTVTFSSTAGGTTFLGLPASEGYGLVGGILVVAIAGGVAVGFLLRRRKSTLEHPEIPAPPASPPGTT